MDMDKIIVDIEQAFDFLPFLNFDNVSIQIDNGDIQPVKDIRWFRNHYRVEYRYKAGQYRYYPNEHEINLVMFP